MKVLIQRVAHASVTVAERRVSSIGRGLLIFVGIEHDDTQDTLQRMANKVLAYRIFPDHQGKMNLNVQEIGGGLLSVSQFTLAANTRKGLRPSFSTAAKPEVARRQYSEFVAMLRALHNDVADGLFGADMKVALLNDGPVTFLLEM